MAFVYLASPYTDDDPDVRQRRYEAVCNAASELMNQGHVVFSAIAHGHSVELYGDVPLGWEFWQVQCFGMLQKAAKVIVLKLDGWTYSEGVAAEIEYAMMHGTPVEYMEVPVAVQNS